MTCPKPTKTRRRAALGLPVLALLLGLTGCPGPDGSAGTASRTVTVYCAHDRIHAEAVLKRFERETGITVRAKWDTEAAKTTGLVNTLIAEAGMPRCDVFWNNEVSQSAVLAERGLAAPYTSPKAQDIPAQYKDADGRWTGFAARSRVFIVNTELVPEDQRPRRLEDLFEPKWRGKVGFARPLFGTTATHAAALFQARGEEGGRAFFQRLKTAGVVICAGNARVKDRVAAGELAWGVTDTDDFNIARLAGKPVVAVFPDQGKDGAGTLVIPNSVVLIKGAPHAEEARALIDFLLDPSVEAELAKGRAAQIPLRPSVERPDWIPAELKAMTVDWSTIGAAFTTAQRCLQAEFLK